VAALAVAVVLAACDDDGAGGPTSMPSSTSPPVDTASAEVVAAWQQLVDEFAAESPELPGLAMAVITPDLDLAVATGSGDPESPDALSPDQPFRIASNTKTFTAAATLRLVEDGVIALDDSIAERVDPALIERLDGDGYDTAAITVEQLLLHTSGIYDYASDVAYQTEVLDDLSQHWERFDQVRFATDHGDPLGQPGTRYAYSDTGYVLLGDLIERATGKSLAVAFRELLHFDQLGLDQTWLESLEPEPAGIADRAHQFYEDTDTYDADPSFDLYGGGGLVSTVGDLATFYRALLTGAVFADPATVTVMTTVPAISSEAGAGMGLFSFEVAELGVCWSHSGYWGSGVITCPEHDFTFAVSVFQAARDPLFGGDELLRRAAELALPGDG
jgi:D-alanyl-D-alanine carboxypeptidase